MKPRGEELPSGNVLILSRRQFRLALLGVWLLVLVTQGVVFAFSEISVRDACGVYLPLARAAALGDWEHAQSVMFPPGYPIVTGLLSRLLSGADYPEELAGAAVNFLAMHAILLCVLVVSLKLWSRRVALVAVGLAGLNPRLLQMSVNVWTEVTFAAVCILAVTALVLTCRKLRWWLGPLLGLLGGAAGLLRSEGVLLPGALVLCVFVCHLRRQGGSVLKVCAVAASVALVSVAVWIPRVAYVHDQTGCAALDLRLASVLGMDVPATQQHWEVPVAVQDIGPTLKTVPREGWRKSGHSLTAAPGKWLAESAEGLMTGWNPVAIFLAIFGLFRRAPLRRRNRAELVFAIVIGMQLLASGVSLYLNPRYMAVVAPLVAILAGVGAVVLSERILARARIAHGSTWWAMGVRDMGRQLGLLALILLVCAVFCVRRAQTRHSGHRRVGELILRTYGPDQRIFACTCESAYYARGRQVPIVSWRTEVYTHADIATVLRETGAAFVLIDKHRQWCPQLAAQLDRGALDGAVIPLSLKENPDALVLLDAERLLPLLTQ